jgi:mevalonate kinase
MSKKINISVPGKIILSGEHAVVYGFPAILAAVDRRLLVGIEKSNKFEVVPAKATDIVRRAMKIVGKKFREEDLGKLKVSLGSQIPIGCGMGSSAAFAVGITAGIFELLNQPGNLATINGCAYEIEKKQHGNPSGGDNTISAYGGFLWYRKEAEGLRISSHLTTKLFPDIFLINSGKPEETTGEMVTRVKSLYLNSPLKIEKTFKEIEATTRGFLRFLLNEESLDIRELIRINERLLEDLGVVSPTTRALIRKIEEIGGAAKISGAGGIKKNSGIVLVFHSQPEALLSFAKKKNLDIFKVKLGVKGVKIEKN